MATPGSFVRSSISSSRNLRRAEHLHDDVLRDLDRDLIAFRTTPRHFPAQRADLTLQIAHARLAGVAANHLMEGVRR